MFFVIDCKDKPNHLTVRLENREAHLNYLKDFEQQLIYNGRVNNSLRFVYREFNNDMARSAFTQEVQYDLKESKIIGFKNVRIEVIEATNSSITYKVLKAF